MTDSRHIRFIYCHPGLEVRRYTPVCYTLQCTKFGQLIVRKIIKIVASRCVYYAQNMLKMWFAAALGAYSAPPDLLAGFKGSTSKGRGGHGWTRREGKGKERGREKGEGGRGKERGHTGTSFSPLRARLPPANLRCFSASSDICRCLLQ